MTTPPRIERARKPSSCPACGHRPVASILYGLPTRSPELQASLDTGRVVLGGCCLSEDDPAWECSQCGQQIHRSKP